MSLTFDGYTFEFSLLTTGNRYEPAQFSISEKSDGVLARTNTLTFGDGAGSTSGLFEVRFDRHEGGFSWRSHAAHPEAIKGIRVAIEGLPLCPVMIPLGGPGAVEFSLGPGDPGRCFVYPGGYYPVRHISGTGVEPRSGTRPDWAAQFVLLRDQGRTLYLHAKEHPPRVKKLWVYRWGDRQGMRLHSEADACRRATEFTAPAWYLDEVDDWRQAVDDHVAWMSEAFDLRPFAERVDAQPWLKDIGLAVMLHGRSHFGRVCHDFDGMTRRLEELASLFPPHRIYLKFIAFENRFDHGRPECTPDPVLGGWPGFRRFTTTARRLGIHIAPHLNVWGASFDNPATQALLGHQIHDSEGRQSTWSWDFDQDEVDEDIMAYISPDAAEWRELLRSKVRELVEQTQIDAIYFDQTGTFINDLHHDHFRGLKTLYAELREELPKVQFTGERPTTEVSVALSPLLNGLSGTGGDDVPEMYLRLFGPFVRQYAYNLPPEPYRGVGDSTAQPDWWSRERFLIREERSARVHAIPTLNLTDGRIRLDGELSRRVLDRARKHI